MGIATGLGVRGSRTGASHTNIPRTLLQALLQSLSPLQKIQQSQNLTPNLCCEECLANYGPLFPKEIVVVISAVLFRQTQYTLKCSSNRCASRIL